MMKMKTNEHMYDDGDIHDDDDDDDESLIDR